MQRVIVVYNKNSSRAKYVKEEVIRPLQKKPGLLVGKYATRKTSLTDNAQRLAMILQDGDVVLVAGGDGTASMAINGVMISGRKVAMKLLPYGNFNDMARAWRGIPGEKWYPLEIKINGEHFWWVGGYCSIGMFAKSTGVFDEIDERATLQRKDGGLACSIWMLMKWYFKNKKDRFLGEGKIDGQSWQMGMSDYLFINTERVARLMRTDGYGLERKKFYLSSGRLTSFWRLIWYMLKSILVRMPGEEVVESKVEFDNDTEVAIQVDGECNIIKKVKTIEVKKSKTYISIKV